jgi:hypothetical protein
MKYYSAMKSNGLLTYAIMYSGKTCNLQQDIIYIKFLKWQFFGWAVLWTEGFTPAKQVLYTWLTPPVHFTLVILKMRSVELVGQADLKLQPSWSQPPELLGLQVWTTGALWNDKILWLGNWLNRWVRRKERVTCIEKNWRISPCINETVVFIS